MGSSGVSQSTEIYHTKVNCWSSIFYHMPALSILKFPVPLLVAAIPSELAQQDYCDNSTGDINKVNLAI